MKKVYLLCSVLIASLSLYSQISSVNLQAIHGCNGATIIPFVVWNSTPNAVTIHYERQGAAATWFAVTSQVQTSTSHIVVSATDISGATNYRVRVVDNS